MKTKNKFLVIILIVLTMINCIYPIANAVTCNLGSDISLTGYGSVANHVRNSESGDYAISTDLVGYYDNGVFYPAYCLNRDKNGADNEYTHTVNVSHILANEDLYNKIWRVVVAGYPFHSAEELGVDDWTYAYQATKTAIYDILGQTDVNNYYGTDDIGRRTVALMKRLVNEGENGTATYKTPVSTINTSGNLQLSGNYYIQNYTVTANVEIESFDIILPGFPTGTITTNTSGIQKSQFKAGETFQVRIPKNAVETGDINGRVLANVNTKSYPIFYGKTYDSKLQDYAITADPIMLTNSSKSLTLQGNTASIQIKKIDTDTNEPISNTVFQLSKQDGSIIGNVTTNSSGIATFNNLYQGNYLIKEITANNNYVLSSEVTNVTATYNQTTNITITNEKKKGQIRVVKVDKDNNEIKLEGVQFNVIDSKGNVVDKLITNANGEATTKKLPVNESYSIFETNTLENYVLNTEKVTVTLKQDEITNVVIENEKKKGQVKVIKVDEDFNEIKLQNVEFNILNSKGEIVDKLITNENRRSY